MSAHIVFILFFLALGACIGSFLNVVVWRLPRGESLTHPPSHCPKCNHLLAWKDNIPVFGWIFLRGRCRYCDVPISARYPVVEFITGALFAAYYVMFFILHVGPCAQIRDALPPDAFGRVVAVNRMPETIYTDWPIYLLSVFLLASLFAASLVDAELFIIPLQIPWLVAGVGIAVHALVDHPRLAGALNVDPAGLGGPLAAGGGLGLGISLLLFLTGRLPVSFAEGEPALEVFQQRESPAAGQPAPPNNVAEARQYTPSEIRREIRKEMLFLLPPLVLALGSIALAHYIPAVRSGWQSALQYHWLSGLLGAVLGALVGGLVVWLARILGTLAFGRVAMGLGDVHLMFGVGAVIGAGPATIAFFIAPFAALLIGLYMWVTRKQRELPYGPYLSLATAAVMLCYCPIADYLRPGMQGLAQLLRVTFGS